MSPLSWMKRLFIGRPHEYRRTLRPAARLQMTWLEERTTPANIMVVGGNLIIDLDVIGEQLTLYTAASGEYTLASTGGLTGDVMESGPNTYTPAASGNIQITDSATGTSVLFADSTVAYAHPVQVNLDTSSAGVTFNGTSDFGPNSLTASTDRSIMVAPGAAVRTSSGDITLVANETTSTVGDFVGLLIRAASVSTTGGNLTLVGRGGTAGTLNHGVAIDTGATVTGGGVGRTVTIEGYGGTGTGNVTDNDGVLIDASLVHSAGADVKVTGQGGATSASTGDTNDGVRVQNGGTLTAGGSGAVTVIGSGGAASGQRQWGVVVIGAASVITSGGGSVSVTGTGGGSGTGTNNFGVTVQSSGAITAGGAGAVTVTGTGSTASGDFQLGVFLIDAGTAITSGGGPVSVTGTGGGSGASAANYGLYVGWGGMITAGAGGPVTVEGTGGVGTNSHGVVAVNGSITSTDSGVLVIGNGHTGAAFGIFQDAGGVISSGGTASLTIGTDSLRVDTSTTPATIRAGTAGDQTVVIRTRTAGTRIDLGGADVLTGILTLGLTAAELNRIAAGFLLIGDGSAGDIAVTSPVVLASIATVGLQTGGGVTQAVGATLTVPNLVILAVNDVLLNEANDVTTGGLAGRIMGAGRLFAFRDSNALTVGTVYGEPGIATVSGGVAVQAGTNLQLNQPINAGVSGISIEAGGAVNQTAEGVLTAASLAVRTGGAVNLATAVNDIDLLTVSAAGSVAFRDADDLTTGTQLGSAGFVADGDIALTTLTSNLSILANVSAGGAVTLASGGALLLGPVTISGRTGVTQTGVGSVVVASGQVATLTSLGAGNITLTSPVDGPGAFVVRTGGSVTFGRAVGGSVPLASLETDAGGPTAINGGVVRTTGNQRYAGDVILRGPTNVIADTVTFLSRLALGTNTLAVDGNFVLGPTATFDTRLESATSFGRVTVTRVARLNGATLAASLVSGFIPAPGTRLVLVDPAVPLTDQFGGGRSHAFGGSSSKFLMVYQTGDAVLVVPLHLYAVGAGAGGAPRVRVFNSASPGSAPLRDFFAFEKEFTGGVRIAVGDVNGDGVDDLVIGAGPGGAPRVRVIDGTPGAIIADFFAYESSLRAGVHVAVGDLNGDGYADLVTGAGSVAGAGGGPRVRAFDGRSISTGGSPDASILADFFAYAPRFRGGVRVAVGLWVVDGRLQPVIITAPGPGGGLDIRVFDRTGWSGGGPLAQLPIPDDKASYRGGAFVTADPEVSGPSGILVTADSYPGYIDTLLGDQFPDLPDTRGAVAGKSALTGDLVSQPWLLTYTRGSGGEVIPQSELIPTLRSANESFQGGARLAIGQFKEDRGIFVAAGPGGLGRVKFFPRRAIGGDWSSEIDADVFPDIGMASVYIGSGG